MWTFIILTVVLAFGVTRIIDGYEREVIMSKWKDYRCKPNIMFTAALYKPRDDPRNPFSFAFDNFSDCTSEIAKGALEVVLKPIMNVVVKMIESSISSIGYLLNLRTLAGNLFNGLERIFDIFGRRFNMTVHEFHITFLKQLAAMQKAQAVSVSALFAGLSMIKAIQNAFELMIIVTIVILVILVVLVIFLFFVLMPVLPLIIMAVATIGGTAYAASTGGMGDTFCFHPNTKIQMSDGTFKRISEITMNDKLANNSSVTSILKFRTDSTTKLYNLDGVIVSGSHIVYNNGVPEFVKDNKEASALTALTEEIYCLNTSNHIIPVIGTTKSWIFADWEELDEDSMEDWSRFIYSILNKCNIDDVTTSKKGTDSETGIFASSLILTKTADTTVIKPIGEIKIGDIILDKDNTWTEVIGTVSIDSEEISDIGTINTTVVSEASWILDTDGKWKHAINSLQYFPTKQDNDKQIMVSLFTLSGTFKIGDVLFRDFSDIGLENINQTYKFTLSRLSHLNQKSLH